MQKSQSEKLKKNTPKARLLEVGKACDRCGHCCTHGSGYVLDSEVDGIASHMGLSPNDFENQYLERVDRYGTEMLKLKTRDNACMLFSKGCTIQTVKPFHCRISTCKEHGEEVQEWFMLNYWVNPANPGSIRQWKARLSAKPTIEGGSVEELVPDKELRRRMLSYELLR